MMTSTAQATTYPETSRPRSFNPPRDPGVERNFAPTARGLPSQVEGFAAGRVEQARAGRVLLVCAREQEVASENWTPFARWLVDEAAAANAVQGGLILDLRRVGRLSSQGLRALTLAWGEHVEGGSIAVCGLNPIVRELFAISHYDRLFEVYDDAASAYCALASRVRN